MKGKKGTKKRDRKPQTTLPIGGGFAVLLFGQFTVLLHFVQHPIADSWKHRKIFASFGVKTTEAR